MDTVTSLKRRSNSAEGNSAKKGMTPLITHTTWTQLNDEQQSNLIEQAKNTDPALYGFIIEEGQIVKRGVKSPNEAHASRKLIGALKNFSKNNKKPTIQESEVEMVELDP
jgi:hypothetical protein